MALSFDETAACARVFEAAPRQIELARLLGLTPSAISNLKRRRKCTLELLLAAAQLTGRPVDWFLFGDRAAPAPAPRAAPAVAPEHAPVVAEDTPSYAESEKLRRLVRRYEQRLKELEQTVHLLQIRLAELERKPGAGSR